MNPVSPWCPPLARAIPMTPEGESERLLRVGYWVYRLAAVAFLFLGVLNLGLLGLGIRHGLTVGGLAIRIYIPLAAFWLAFALRYWAWRLGAELERRPSRSS